MRQWIPSPAGRKRFNVLGALNAITHNMLTVTNSGYINSWSVVELLRKIRAAHPIGQRITVVLDNARYQRCYLVQRAAYMENIELLFLPPYSPNLNLIERVWKFIKKKALINTSYRSFDSFQEGINECIEKFTTDYREDLKTLLTLNFQVF